MPILGSVEIKELGWSAKIEYLNSCPDAYNFFLTYQDPFIYECFFFFADKDLTIQEMDEYDNAYSNAVGFLRDNFDLIYSAAIKLKIKCDL